MINVLSLLSLLSTLLSSVSLPSLLSSLFSLLSSLFSLLSSLFSLLSTLYSLPLPYLLSPLSSLLSTLCSALCSTLLFFSALSTPTSLCFLLDLPSLLFHSQTVGVVVCENQLPGDRNLEELLTHELIHAFDHCRAEVNWDDCEHHACSEIRAAALSGDCRYSNEFFRGNFAFSMQHQRCVKRRAILSVAANPSCSKEKAEAAVESAFDRCYFDTMPFDHFPR